MDNRILKIDLKKLADIDPAINVWNIFDSEHPPFVHGKRKTGEGMDPSFIIFENSSMNVTYDTQKLPIISFFKYKSLMIHIDNGDNSVTQICNFFGVMTLQKYSAYKLSENQTEFRIQVLMYLHGFWYLLKPFIKSYLTRWINNTWIEDLAMKERKNKFHKLGFKEMIGMPTNIDARSSSSIYQSKLPLIRALSDCDSHPFSYKHHKELFK